MKKYIVLSCCLVMMCMTLKAQTDTIARRIILIGDAGQLTDGRHPVVDAVKNNIPLDKNYCFISRRQFVQTRIAGY